MAKSKKSSKKPSVKVQDLEPEADPKGGAVDVFLKFDPKISNVQLETEMNTVNTGIKIDGTTSTLNRSLKAQI